MEVPDKAAGLLPTVTSFMEKLTLPRVLLALLLAGGSVMLYAVWEDRRQWAGTLWQSPAILGAIGVGGLLLGVGMAINNLQQRLDARTSEIYRNLREQIEVLQREIHLGREERLSMQTQMVALQLAEQQCQTRVQLLQKEIEGFTSGRRRTDP